ncbi:hypothetical protein HanXRQr2_Chr09g0415131 [Helianthus annuus]|uniref:Uncharacterized protein n=1 Tax=Helianthus annuus TaxID=4232 RepID=A0A9K3NAQ8_HELAN|nr:hypothetical protein HanXRQr2_Chr09g0415131 [Helianthus annuus]
MHHFLKHQKRCIIYFFLKITLYRTLIHCMYVHMYVCVGWGSRVNTSVFAN